MNIAAALAAGALLFGTLSTPTGQPQQDEVVAAVEKLDRNARWTITQQTSLQFPTHHPQGLARVGDKLYLSSVEVIERPVKYPAPIDGYDRTPGKGVGHLFELDLTGKLLRQITLGEDIIYHPGGIDFDGRDLWVPVAEYRPNSRAIVYKVDPATLGVSEAFRYRDHVGGVVRDRTTGLVHGVSWGSRRLFSWTANGRLLANGLNESHYVDFQDCAAAGRGKAICTGITEFPTAGGGRFDLGGIAVVDVRAGKVGHEVPVTVLSPNGRSVTRNPVHLETADGKLRMWSAPDDGEEPGGTRLLVLETPIG